MQSVLITGDFIRQNLVHAWRRARPADRVVVIDAMTYAANIRSLEPLIADHGIVFVKGNIGDGDLMRRLFEEQRFTRVAHLAAESHVDRSIADPEAFLQTNVLGTFTLLKTALDAWRVTATIDAARFLHVSTMRSTARLALPIQHSRNPRRTVRTRPTPRARRRAIISCARSSEPTGCRR